MKNNNLTQELIINSTNLISKAQEEVQASFPSIYSKNDVVQVLESLLKNFYTMINDIEVKYNGLGGLQQVVEQSIDRKKLTKYLKENIHDDICLDDYFEVDTSTAEFKLYYNEIELDKVEPEINTIQFKYDIECYIENTINNFFEEEIKLEQEKECMPSNQ